MTDYLKPAIRKRLRARFWKLVHRPDRRKDTCWIWTRSPKRGRCGMLGWQDLSPKFMRAYRAAWLLTYGPIPAGMRVFRSCHNAFCCRPSHLFLSEARGGDARGDRNGARTKPERNTFVRNRGSGVIGERHPQAKLTDAEVAQLRSQWAEGRFRSKSEAARVFRIGQPHCSRILNGHERKEVAVSEVRSMV